MKTFLCVLAVFLCSFSPVHADDAAMTVAIELDNVSAVKRMIDRGEFQVDSKINGNPLLSHAARGAALEVMRFLIERKANVNIRNSRDETPLMFAAFFPDVPGDISGAYEVHEQAVNILLSAGADLENLENAFTPLAYAAYAKHDRIVKRLLEAGAKPDGSVKNGTASVNTPLIMATLAGSAESVRLILAHGADPLVINGYGKDALFYALRDGHKGIVKMLRCALDLEPGKKFSEVCK